MSSPARSLGRPAPGNNTIAIDRPRSFAGSRSLAAVLAFATLLLLAASRIPLAFEDSYHHWLIAAELAQTGRLRDPLFGMEDTWLPGYHVAAAAILQVVGLWQIGALRAFSAACALATLALLFRIAGGGAKGVIAVLFVSLNPIFLLTATSVVAEPLLTLCLLGTTTALLQDRRRLAAVLALVACLVGTKAWLWLVLLAAGYPLLSLVARSRSRAAISWLLPALLLAAVLEVLISPAAHSVSRAAAEVGAAAARGNIAANPITRGTDFLGYFALAALPLVVLAPLGFLHELHDPGAGRRLALVHAPALMYVAAVTGLVFVGAYTGSHRYLYPALPALGLLAATAIHRSRWPAIAGALAGAVLVTVAFLPVLQSFGTLDEGLARAGVAASGVPGELMTDSPVAAYSSGKPPSQIRGSRDLPADPEAAVLFLRANGVGSLVLEDISYYRVNKTFPGLAGGSAIPPFLAIGTPADYSVAGGKTVAVYRVTGELRFIRSAAGTGKTENLASGAVLELDGRTLNGEGLGFGVPLLRYPDGDWFAGTRVVTDLGTPGESAWRTVYSMDRRGMADDTAFLPAPSRGAIEVTYRATGRDLDVSVRVLNIDPGYRELLLMNEQSAAFDDYADSTRTLVGASVGSWTPVRGDWARFRSGALGLEWSLPRLGDASGFHAARESRAPGIDFSGLEYSFGPGFSGADYTVKVGDAR